MVGRCSGWVDLGMQRNRWAEGKDAPMQRRVMIMWTLEGAAGERWRVCREFSWCAGPRSALRKLLEEWRGQPYASDDEAWKVLHDPRKLLEQPCLVRVVLKPGSQPGMSWPEVAGVWPMMKGQPPALPLKWPPVLYLPEMLKHASAGEKQQALKGVPRWVVSRCAA